MSREEVLYNWLELVKKIIVRSFLFQGRNFDERRLFWYRFPEPFGDAIDKVIRNLGRLSIWKNRNLSSTVFGGKQNYDFWRSIFETGNAPTGFQVMPQGINLDELLRD